MDNICTVLLISYNHAPYIGKAIDSVLAQKTKYPFIIHIFDDCSKDGTQEVIRQYQKKYPERIFATIAEKNRGAQANIWAAYQSVKTKYFNVLECDDYFCDEQKLELQIAALEKHPECSFCGHDTYLKSLDDTFREYPENSRCCTEPLLRRKNIFTLKDFDPINSGGYIPYPSARMIRTACLHLDTIKYKESVLFDFTSFYYFLLQGDYYYIDRPMSVYLRTGDGTCSKKSPLEFLNTFVQNAIDFNRQTNNVIADKIFRECQLQTGFRLELARKNPSVAPGKKIKNRQQHIIPYDSEDWISGKDGASPYDIWTQINKLDQERMYFLLNGGIGIVMQTVGFRKALEERYQAPITFVVQEKHAFILDMLGETNYLVTDIDKINIPALSDLCPNPERGGLYVCHPYAHREKTAFYLPMLEVRSTKRFTDWYKESLNLKEEALLSLPKYAFPEIDGNLKKKLKVLKSLDKTVAIFPEAYNLPGVSTRFWQEKVRLLKKQGFEVVSCVQNEANTITGTIYFEFTLEEAVTFAAHCARVYTTRNGLGDILWPLGDRLTVYHPSFASMFLYSLAYSYGDSKAVEELIISAEYPAVFYSEVNPPKRHAKMFGVTVPDFAYHFYLRHKAQLKPLKRFVKWTS